MTPPETLTLREFGAHLHRLRGWKANYAYQLRNQGRLVLTEDGKAVRVAESIARIDATESPDKAHVAARHAETRAPGTAPEPPQGPPADEPIERHDYQNARAKREHYAALQEEIAYRKAAGELIEVATVTAFLADAMTVLRNSLETLPDTLAPRLAPMTDEQPIRALLAEEVESILTTAERRVGEVGK